MNTSDEKGYSLIVDVALLIKGEVLLLKYGDPEAHDGQPGWFIPDDSIKYLEHPEQAAQRVLHEQLGLEGMDPVLDHIESFAGNNGSWHLAFHYKIELDAQPKIKQGKPVSATKWFNLNSLPQREEVAHHGWALNILKKIQSQAKE
ncbi:MAG: NUDIX domain-containing protein [Anaerolineales bacterium]